MKSDAEVKLIQSLYCLVGNKRYMKDIEGLIHRIDLKPEEQQALRFLAADLTQSKNELNKTKRNVKNGRFF